MDVEALGLTHKDFLFDGHPCNEEQWANIDWSKAWIDLGPSPAGNLGPYWHVPHRDEENEGTVHRLYPKVLRTKWAPLILQACIQHTINAMAKPQQWAESCHNPTTPRALP